MAAMARRSAFARAPAPCQRGHGVRGEDDHASVDDLEKRSPPTIRPKSSGWRHDLFGAKALELKHGRLALIVEQGKVVPLEWRDAGAPPENGAS
jgi:hypothetical protein